MGSKRRLAIYTHFLLRSKNDKELLENSVVVLYLVYMDVEKKKPCRAGVLYDLEVRFITLFDVYRHYPALA